MLPLVLYLFAPSCLEAFLLGLSHKCLRVFESCENVVWDKSYFYHNVFAECTSFLSFCPPFQIEISRRVTLEELPPVLVLHLKRFIFEKTGGCQKLTKNIDYPVDLEISKGI